MPLVLIFLALPLVEIALLIVIGGRLGLWPTLALILLSVIVGLSILRAHQARAVQVMERGLSGISPGTFLAQGAFQVVAGMLLILPGFLTDAVGLALLAPPVQRMILHRIRARLEVRQMHVRTRRDAGGEIIEGQYETRDESDPKRHLDDRGGH